MKQAESKTVSENPFYGMKGMLAMQKLLERMDDKNPDRSSLTNTLAGAWREAGDTVEGRQLFFILLFSFGDIENRQHNMFTTKVDQGGHSKRKVFRMCLAWVLQNCEEYFYTLLPVIAEYTNYENLFYNQLRTDAWKKTLLSWEKLEINKQKLAKYLKEELTDPKTTEFDKSLIAKFLPKPPQKHRWRKDKEGKSFAQLKRPHTLKKDEWTKSLIAAITTEMGWDLKEYRKFRSTHLKLTEAYLFSTKEIQQYDKIQFISWLETLPSGARYRVQRRLFDKEGTTVVSNKKWKLKGGYDMGDVYTKWMNDKEKAMKELAALTVEQKLSMDAGKLNQLQKQAKINTGATTIFDSFMSIYGTSSYGNIDLSPENAVRIQQLVDKVKMDVPVLCILDNSGSMSGRLNIAGKNIERLEFAKFACSLMLYKNASEDFKSFMVKFNSTATVIHDGGFVNKATGQNRFITSSTNHKLKELVLKGKPFIETFKQLNSLIHTEGATDLTSVSKALKTWVDEDPNTKAMKIETIQNYPVFLIISDGDLNNGYTPKESMLQFKSQMLQWFGATPVIVLWDIVQDGAARESKFSEVDNMIHVAGFNPAIINQIFVNINDMDVLDVFVSLQTVFRSNRYEPVKQLIK